MTTNTPDHSRALYETQLRLNGKLVDEVAACRQAYTDQAAELAEFRDRDSAAASLAKMHNELLEIWGERLSYLEDQFIASLREAERLAPVEHTLAARKQAFHAERSAAHLAKRMDPAAK